MKLGFLVDNLGASQLGYYLSKNINDALERYDDLDIICYYENFEGKCMHQNFSNINISGAWSQEGVMIATSPSTAEKMANFIGRCKKYFYVWDDHHDKTYYNLGSIYFNKDIQIICRNNIHARIIENNFNIKVRHTVDNFDIDKIMEIVTS